MLNGGKIEKASLRVVEQKYFGFRRKCQSPIMWWRVIRGPCTLRLLHKGWCPIACKLYSYFSFNEIINLDEEKGNYAQNTTFVSMICFPAFSWNISKMWKHGIVIAKCLDRHFCHKTTTFFTQESLNGIFAHGIF